MELVGDPSPVAEQVGVAGGGAYGFFTASANTLVYRGGSGGGVQLTWFDRQGKVLGTLGDPGMVLKPAISPDGRTVAFDRIAPQSGWFDVWLQDLQRGTTSRLTFGPRTSASPVWSPDGSQVAFYSNRDLVEHIYRKSTSGVAPVEILDARPQNARILDWSRDGRYLIEVVVTPKTQSDIWVLPLFGDRKAFPYLQSEFSEFDARLSPDGRWLAYVSDETGRLEVYIQTFPAPGGKWQVSTSGGSHPVWSRNGKEIFFISEDRRITAVEVGAEGAKFEASVPKPLFKQRMVLGAGTSFDVGPDGRFLIPSQLEQVAAAPMTVVVNWASGLK
jgi:Tol biopolymer transport system component